jgi:hypothetical protein
MAATDIWELTPKQGLGPLKLGMAPDEALSAATVFGSVVHDQITHDDAYFEDTYQYFVKTMGLEEADRAMEVMRSIDVKQVRTVILSGGVHLTFMEERLFDIMCDKRAVNTHVGGMPLYGADPLMALRHLEGLNGAPPLLKKLDCFFANIHVTDWAFLSLGRNGRPRLLAPGSVDAEARTIGLGVGPRDIDDDLSKHMAVSVG